MRLREVGLVGLVAVVVLPAAEADHVGLNPAGDAEGYLLAVAAGGNATSEGTCLVADVCYGGAALAVFGDAQSGFLAGSVAGSADCTGDVCVVATVNGEASCGSAQVCVLIDVDLDIQT